MRRVTRLIAVLGLLLAGLMIGQSNAVAAPSGAHALAPGTCPTGTTYPPSPGAMIMASTTTPFVGQTIEVSGKNYCPDEDVTITLRGKKVGMTHTDAKGAFDPPLKVTGPTGPAELAGIGASGLSNDRDSLTLNVRAGESGPGTPGSPSGGGLPFTGTEVAGMIVLAAILLGGGVAMIYAGRRKRSVRS